MPYRLSRVLFSVIAAALAVIALTGADVLDSPYREDGWAKLPDGRMWGQSAAVDIDRAGNIWVFERCASNTCIGSNLAPIIQLDPSGKFLKAFGANLFVYPHGIFTDPDGSLWVTDAKGKDGKGHQVFKFSADGKILLTLGRAGVAGDGPDTFNEPTDVLVAPNGNIFVSDGHGGDSNARIVKFTKDGKFIKTWGKKGKAPGEFDTPHGLAMDSQGRLFVADRGNNRIQIFDQEGNFLAEWKQFGRPSGIFIDANDVLLVADHQSNAKFNPGGKRGIRIGSARDGSVKALIPGLGQDPETQSVGEGVAMDANGNVYMAETGGMMVRKFARRQ